ncbi:unnamed protein product [Blepharisma stoltei]|uniref:Uncharacterized protein n=1 Tax=Blepharisma stoltei TaxID=1481888 RepID=A0AAU9IND3_9CILI|nr:unnamed protein product [Blepharisma stoltei]
MENTEMPNSSQKSTPLLLHIEGDVFYVPCILSTNGQDFRPLLQPIAPAETRYDSLKTSTWSLNEDIVLYRIVEARGLKGWKSIAKELNSVMHQKVEVRNGRQCREHWYNHVDPSLRKGEWTSEEDIYILEQQRIIGNKWSEIARGLSGRTENSVKNRWKSLVKKSEKLSPGSDPVSLVYKQTENNEAKRMRMSPSIRMSPSMRMSPSLKMSPSMMSDRMPGQATLSPQMKMFGFRELPPGYRDGVAMWNQIYFQSNQENITGTPSPSIFLSM